MQIVHLESGRTCVDKRRVRYNERGQPRELTFSCYHHYAFLSHDRTREWFYEAWTRFALQLWAYVVMPEHVHVLAYPGEAPERMSGFLRTVKLEMDQGVLEELARG